MIERVSRDKKQNYSNALADAKDGTNGGMMQMFDCIAEAMKNEDIEDYIAEALDCYAVCDSFTEQRALIQDMFAELGNLLPKRLRNRPPEDFVANYRELVRTVITDILKRP
jgi:hypothetical protein